MGFCAVMRFIITGHATAYGRFATRRVRAGWFWRAVSNASRTCGAMLFLFLRMSEFMSWVFL